jgi:hypothetical protein
MLRGFYWFAVGFVKNIGFTPFGGVSEAQGNVT